jgi:hypothetical protein
MTRDEAIAKVKIVYDPSKLTNPPAFIVDALASLGILKLDEPMSPEEKLALVLGATNIRDSLGTVMRAIESAGLKIVEK